MSGPVVIIGGAGFIGSNLASHLAARGHLVRILDDLSGAGVEANLTWLEAVHGDRIQVCVGDVRDRGAVRAALSGAGVVYHLAGQTGVTTSLAEPFRDFSVNALGTLEVLEAVRACGEPPPLVYTSTNKVYGGLPDVPLRPAQTRWEPVDPELRANGIDETRQLDLHTPFGCSKGCADQYVLDYAHTYRLPATVLRASCVYGPRQLGTDDQGWVAHFIRRTQARETISICGDGRQVRDVLYVDDFVDALVRTWTGISAVRGRAFNIGGGPEYTLSPIELLELLEKLGGTRPHVRYMDWRPGDQRYYISDTRALREATGWRPRISPRAGIEALYAWLDEARTGGSLHA